MRIATVECFGLEAPLEEPFGFSQAWVRQRRTVLVRIATADGVEGWGEIFCQSPPSVYVAVLSQWLAPQILGADPWDRDVLWQRLYNRTIDSGQRGLVVGGLSGIDIALWDLIGRDCGQPIHRLLGGLARSHVEAYATGLYRPFSGDWLGALRTEADAHVRAGFRTVKMKVGFGIKQDVAAVEAVREAVGAGVGLAVDANHAYKPAQAIELGRRLAAYDVAWFEEPVSPEDLAGYAEVRARQPIPVAGGELAYTRFGFRELLEHRAADILQPDLCLCGGLSEARAIAEMARAWNVRCWAHVWGTGIGQSAAVHFLGWLPNETAYTDVDPPLVEWDLTDNPLRQQVVADGPRARDGQVAVPTGPGLGVTVDRAALARFQVAYASVDSASQSAPPVEVGRPGTPGC